MYYYLSSQSFNMELMQAHNLLLRLFLLVIVVIRKLGRV